MVLGNKRRLGFRPAYPQARRGPRRHLCEDVRMRAAHADAQHLSAECHELVAKCRADDLAPFRVQGHSFLCHQFLAGVKLLGIFSCWRWILVIAFDVFAVMAGAKATRVAVEPGGVSMNRDVKPFPGVVHRGTPAITQGLPSLGFHWASNFCTRSARRMPAMTARRSANARALRMYCSPTSSTASGALPLNL